MKTNIDTIQDLIHYIEDHLNENLCLDVLAQQAQYSKYHLSKLFTSMAGMSLHMYIQRRRLSEAARLLVNSDITILELALSSGYETQQSFTKGFKEVYHCTPHAYRKRKVYQPVQLPYQIEQKPIQTDDLFKVSVEKQAEMKLVGYRKSTRFGFFVIGACWHKLHAHKHRILHRKDPNVLIGLNDYTNWKPNSDHQPAFEYVAGAEVTTLDHLPKGMVVTTLPPSNYLVFHFHAHSQDSLESISEYIYQTYLPQTAYELDEKARYDFVIYDERVDEQGNSDITYWVPIRS